MASPGADRRRSPLASLPGAPDLPTQPTPPLPPPRAHSVVRLFGSHDFFRLWLAQVVNALGDWIGFLAIVTIAGRLGGSSSGAAVGVVMTARILPGFFLGPVAGVLVDRWDRKRVMVAADVGRGLVFATLPFMDSLPQLVVASLLLEVLTLLWSPAKEATVPNLVPAGHLATANSLSLLAAYGSFPLASALFAALAKVADLVAAGVEVDVNQETAAVAFNVLSFFLSALFISTLALPRRARSQRRRADGRLHRGTRLSELREGWRFIVRHRRVRAVMMGLGTGLIGGGMLVPLGEIFTSTVLGGGPAGFGLVLTALGTGVGAGVLVVSLLQARLPKATVFAAAVLAAGISLLLAASVSSLAPALVFVAAMGVAAGFVYVLGFTILQESVEDELRGRTFSALYTLVRLCLLIAFAVGPFLAEALGRLSRNLFGGELAIGDASIAIPGVRLALWLAGLIIVAAGALVVLQLGRRPLGARRR